MSFLDMLNLLLRLSGLSMLGLAGGHIYFSKLLDWDSDCKKLKPINEQVFYAHTIFLTGGISLLGICCLFFAQAMTEKTTLGAVGSACFAMCWFSRLVCQFAVFKAPLSVDARLNATLRAGGTTIWIFYTLLFCAVFAYQVGVIGN